MSYITKLNAKMCLLRNQLIYPQQCLLPKTVLQKESNQYESCLLPAHTASTASPGSQLRASQPLPQPTAWPRNCRRTSSKNSPSMRQQNPSVLGPSPEESRALCSERGFCPRSGAGAGPPHLRNLQKSAFYCQL